MARAKKIPVRQKEGGHAMMDNSGFTRFLASNSEAARNHAAARAVMASLPKLSWRGDSVVPPGTPPHDILEAFREHTDIPLELPWNAFMFYLSTLLHSNGTKIKIKKGRGGMTVTPEIWLVSLAPSGSGKSFSLGIVGKGAPVGPSITGIASGAKLIEEMSNNEAAGIPNAMLDDEFAQTLKGIETPGAPLSDSKPYFLKSYDGATLERKTKAQTIIVDFSKMPVLGLNVDETFYGALSNESILDGFAQRFIYSVAASDPERPQHEFPIYDTVTLEEVARAAWEKLLLVPIHDEYTYAPETLEAYENEFRSLGKMIHDGGQVNASFFRRLMQATHKLALFMHIILGDASPVIKKTAMLYAIRQTRLNVLDAAKLIAMKAPKAMALMSSIDDLAERLAAKGERMTPRTIRQYVHETRENPELADALMAAHSCAGSAQSLPPKRRGRPTKAEAEARKAQSELDEAAAKMLQKPTQQARSKPAALDIDDLIRDHRDENGASVYTG